MLVCEAEPTGAGRENRTNFFFFLKLVGCSSALRAGAIGLAGIESQRMRLVEIQVP